MDYSLLNYDSGCCLHCSDAHDGCLCYECKCTQCEYYIPPYDNDLIKGRCGKIDELREERKLRFIYLSEQEKEKRYINKLKLDKLNIDTLKRLKENKEIPSYYTCQRCFNVFITNKELTIKERIEPICPICSDGRSSN